MSHKFFAHKWTIVGAGAIIIAALLWSLDGVFLRPHFYDIPVIVVVFLEHILGFFVLLPWLIQGRRKVKVLSKTDRLAIIGVSILGGLIGTFFITNAFFAAYGGQITLATVILLQKLQPIFALVLARVLLKEKLPAKFYVWALLAIGAGYILAFGNGGFDIFSIEFLHHAAFYSLIAAFAFGASTVLGKKIVNNLDFKLTTGLRFGLTSLFAFIVLAASADIGKLASLTTAHWIYLVIVVFTSGAAAMFLYYFGLKRVKASQATILELFWPLSAVFLDYFINGSMLTPIQIGAVIILLFSIFQIVRAKNKIIQFSAGVIHGQGRGFHTANLDIINLDIPHGVYIATVTRNKKKYKALMHFGYRSTFHDSISTEVYLHNFDGDLYGQQINVEVREKIRDIITFVSPEDLKEQIAKDIKHLE